MRLPLLATPILPILNLQRGRESHFLYLRQRPRRFLPMRVRRPGTRLHAVCLSHRQPLTPGPFADPWSTSRGQYRRVDARIDRGGEDEEGEETAETQWELEEVASQ